MRVNVRTTTSTYITSHYSRLTKPDYTACHPEKPVVCPVKFSLNVTPTFSRLFSRVGTQKQFEKNRTVEKPRNPVSKKKTVEVAVFGQESPRNHPQATLFGPKRYLLPRGLPRNALDAQQRRTYTNASDRFVTCVEYPSSVFLSLSAPLPQNPKLKVRDTECPLQVY